MTELLIVGWLLSILFTFVLLDRNAKRADAERQILLERIQRPELRPVSNLHPVPDPEADEDEYGLVGTIEPGQNGDAA